jgi:tetratricopeptide (TPR) repeat protein
MVQKVAPASFTISSLEAYIPESKIARIGLCLLGGVVILSALRSLIGRAASSIPKCNAAARRYYDQGLAKVAAKDFAEAARLFDQALRSNATDQDLRAGTYNELGNIYKHKWQEKAFESFSQAIDCKPPDESHLKYALFMRGSLYFSRENYRLALIDLQKALPYDHEPPIKAKILVMIGSILCLEGKFEAAKKKCQEGLDVGFPKKQYLLLTRLGMVCAEKNQHDHASFYFEAALASQAGEKGDAYADILKHRALPYFLSGKYDASFKDLSEALECKISDAHLRANILFNRSNIHQRRNDTDLAVKDLIAARECNPTCKELNEEINATLEKLKDPDYLGFANAEWLYNLGNERRKNKDFAGARTCFAEALAVNLEKHTPLMKAKILLNLGTCFCSEGAFAEASEKVEESWACNPPQDKEYSMMLGFLGQVYANKGMLDEELKSVSRALSMSSIEMGDLRACHFYNRAVIFNQQKKSLDCLEDLGAALQCNPSNERDMRALILHLRCLEYKNRGNKSASLQDLKDLEACNPQLESIKNQIPDLRRELEQ